ncbi:MAG: N-acetylmuramoyl-L-alanine amidase [Candidatus Omnitrophota bacterium]|jgi:N-acetylmuramoyl-L-alanine amidase
MKIRKLSVFILALGLLALSFSGCATVSTRETLTTYNIGGVSYVSLSSLCGSQNISWKYDTFIRTVSLTKGGHKINLMVGEKLVLVDDAPEYLSYPVDIYQGAVVVPYRFKEQVLDRLFKGYRPQRTAATCAPAVRIRKVVIDAGHGGKDPGAIGRNGLKEKDVNLDIAKRLSKMLKAEGIDVVMTRSSDIFVSLARRVSIANSSGADLFISVHANANHVRSLKGLEVYYVSPKADDSKRALYCAQNANLGLKSSSFASTPSLNLRAILWDMIHTSNRAESVKLARGICHSVDSSVNIRIIGVKSANFYVLKGVRMPAILVETGFLSNYQEEKLLRNSYYRQQIAEGICEGVKIYARERASMEMARQ